MPDLNRVLAQYLVKLVNSMSDDGNAFRAIRDFREQFRLHMLRAVKDGLGEVRDAVSGGNYIGTYYEWPRLSYRDNGLPQLSSSSFQGPKEYRGCFGVLGREPLVIEQDISSFNDLVDFVKDRPSLLSRFVLEHWESQNKGLDLDIDLPAMFIRSTIKDAIERYAHIYGTFDFDESRANNIVAEVESVVFDESLNIDILVPILFVDFEFDIRELVDGIKIQRIDEKFHLARSKVRSRNVSVHDSVLSSATHALVLENWCVPNADRMLQFDILDNPRAYPLDRIDKFFGAVRIVTGFDTGYAQVLAAAKGWIRDPKADLPYIEGATVRCYPARLEDYYWNLESIPVVSPEQVEAIAKVYGGLENAKEKKIDIAVKRLNLCLVRDSEEDLVLDAAIALEALLSDDGNQEMTHKLAMRVGALSKLSVSFGKTPQQAFKDVKSIYAYRSAIVHGSKNLDKKRVIRIDAENEVAVHSLAVEYVRKLLKILIENPDFRDVKRIDDELLLGGGT